MKRLAWLVPMCMLALVACSKSDNGTTASSPPQVSTAASSAPSASSAASGMNCAQLSHLTPLTDKGVKSAQGSVSLNADNDGGKFYFEPTCVESKGTLSVTVKNVGDVEHNFSITSLHIDKDIEKGESVTVSVALPASGTLPFFCKYHKTSGMQGAFVVQ